MPIRPPKMIDYGTARSNKTVSGGYTTKRTRTLPPNRRLPLPPSTGFVAQNFTKVGNKWVRTSGDTGYPDKDRGENYWYYRGYEYPRVPASHLIDPFNRRSEFAENPFVGVQEVAPEDYYGYYYGGGGDRYVQPPEEKITWSEKYTLPGAPSWWKGMMPSKLTPQTELISLMNNIIPYLSEEDQRTVASNIYQTYPEWFGFYGENTAFLPYQKDINTPIQDYYTSTTRAQNLMAGLDKYREVSGKSETELGGGYRFLRRVVDATNDFGGNLTTGNRQTRGQYLEMLSTLDPLLAEANGEQLGAYGVAARTIAQPFFTHGKLINVFQDDSGKWRFGGSQKSWY